VGETAIGFLMLALALAAGMGPNVGWDTSIALYVAGAALALAAVGFAGRRHARVRAFLTRMKSGCAILKSPAAYGRHVLPWQLLSRLARVLALGCFLAAFHLPATLAAVMLVTFAQCSGRLVPFSPASVGAGTAILAACFGPVTGTNVPAAELAAFFVGTSTVLTVVGTALALVLCGTQASAKAGPSEAGRLMRIRAAISPRA